MNVPPASYFVADDPPCRNDATAAVTRRGTSSTSANFTIESLMSTSVSHRTDRPTFPSRPLPLVAVSASGDSPSTQSTSVGGVMFTRNKTNSTTSSLSEMTNSVGYESRDGLRGRLMTTGELSGALPSGVDGTYPDYFRSVIKPSVTTPVLPAYGLPSINPPPQPLHSLVHLPYHRYSYEAPLQQLQTLPVPHQQLTPGHGLRKATQPYGPSTRRSVDNRSTTSHQPSVRRNLVLTDAEPVAAVSESRPSPSPPSKTESASLDAMLPAQYAANLPLYAAWLLSERGNTYLNSLGSDNSLLFPFHKRKRFRTSFNPHQLIRLEEAFQLNRYMVGQERRELADSLGLTETQIKVWFQNRRTKQKKDPMAIDQVDDDDDEDPHVTSGATDVEPRDCRGSLTSLSSPSESEYIDVESPGCSHHHHHHHGGQPLSLPRSATSSSSSSMLLLPVYRGLRDMQAAAAELHCSF